MAKRAYRHHPNTQMLKQRGYTLSALTRQIGGTSLASVRRAVLGEPSNVGLIADIMQVLDRSTGRKLKQMWRDQMEGR